MKKREIGGLEQLPILGGSVLFLILMTTFGVYFFPSEVVALILGKVHPLYRAVLRKLNKNFRDIIGDNYQKGDLPLLAQYLKDGCSFISRYREFLDFLNENISQDYDLMSLTFKHKEGLHCTVNLLSHYVGVSGSQANIVYFSTFPNIFHREYCFEGLARTGNVSLLKWFRKHYLDKEENYCLISSWNRALCHGHLEAAKFIFKVSPIDYDQPVQGNPDALYAATAQRLVQRNWIDLCAHVLNDVLIISPLVHECIWQRNLPMMKYLYKILPSDIQEELLKDHEVMTKAVLEGDTTFISYLFSIGMAFMYDDVVLMSIVHDDISGWEWLKTYSFEEGDKQTFRSVVTRYDAEEFRTEHQILHEWYTKNMGYL